MKTKDVTIKVKSYGEFTVSVDDWENAFCPICMKIITNNAQKQIAKILKEKIEELIIRAKEMELNGETWEDFMSCNIWSYYEHIVCTLFPTFYYEDCTDKEMDILNSENCKRKDIEKIYKRIKN